MTEPFFTPVSGFDLPRFAGVPTFMRLPQVPPGHPRFGEVDIGRVVTPWDSVTTNRPGPRHGPRQLRDASTMIRAQHPVTLQRPFDLLDAGAAMDALGQERDAAEPIRFGDEAFVGADPVVGGDVGRHHGIRRRSSSW